MLFHIIDPKQDASTSIPERFMGLHRFCQSLLCLQLFLKRKTKAETVSITISFVYAELVKQS